jgi:hypothetical protein
MKNHHYLDKKDNLLSVVKKINLLSSRVVELQVDKEREFRDIKIYNRMIVIKMTDC